jgi:hypothetical protein
MRGTWCSFAFVTAALLLAACSTQPKTIGDNARLAPVAALPKPSVPPWIAHISPSGRAQSLAQIRIIFVDPVTKVESLSGAGPQSVLSHLRVDPELPGHFVVYTPRLIGFVAEKALPVGTRVRVTLTAGLSDLAGHTLDRDLAWTFTTAPLELGGLPSLQASPGETPTPAPLRPSIEVIANAKIDPLSLAQRTTLRGGDRTIAVDVALEPTPTPFPGEPPDASEAFDSSRDSWTYLISPREQLARSTTYAIDIAPGVQPERGNLPTDRAVGGSIHTFDQLAVVPTPTPDPHTGVSGTRFVNGDPEIDFNNAIDPKTIAGNVTISPLPAPSPQISGSSTSISIDPYALEPDRDYTITIGTGVKDVYGQSLSAPAQIAVHTGDFAPGEWAPDGATLIPANSGVDVNFYATNLPGNTYRAAFAALSPERMLAQPQAADVLPSPPSSWPLQTLAGARTNRQSVVRVNVQQQLSAAYGALAYGFWSPLLDASESSAISGIVQVTNLGIFAQFFPMHATILTQHLSDGSPAAASISVYRVDDDASPQQCASGTAGANGEFSLSGADVARCYAGATSGGMGSIGVIAREGADAATLRVYDYSGAYRFDVPYGWAGGAPRSAGTVVPDRDLYQPGERAAFTGFAYYVQDGAVHADANASYSLELTDPSGSEHDLGTVTTDRYGTFAYSYTFPKSQALGYYSISGEGTRGFKVSGDFRIAEFKPPNFKLDVAASATAAPAGASVTATATGAYLFGAPLDGGKARVAVTREIAQLEPDGWDQFSFGRQWFWPEQPPEIPSDVLQRTVTLDAAGKAAQSVTIPSDLPAPMTYTVEFNATDVSQLSVANSASFLAMPADGLIGLSSDTVTAANTALPVKVIVTDASGKALSGKSVHLELQHMTYTSASQAEEGGESAQQAIRYDTVDRADVTSSDRPVSAPLTPNAAGAYRIRATFPGASEAGATDVQVFAFGPGAADFGARDTTSVAVTLDKKKYKVGDTATVAIGSPYDHADVYVAVVRHDTIYRTVLRNVSGAPHVSFRVTPQMFPNAAVEAVVVRRGAPLSTLKAGALDSLSRTGLAAFNIDLHDRYLKLGIAPQHAKLAPGSAQRLDFTLADAAGHPARGKIVVAVVNEAVLQLSGYRFPDLVTTVFADQPISLRFADNRENVTLQTPQAPLEKGYGYGGGFLGGAAGTRVRTNFLPLAYYGSAIAGADGRASLAFTLPDDLTTWRAMAVAIGDDDAHFGTGDATFIAQLPLMANPLLPQFARPGDVLDGGASVLGLAGGELDLLLSLQGALRFQSGDPATLHVTAQAGTQIAAYRYPIVAGTPGPARLGVRAAIGNARDAFAVPLTILDRATTESVIDAGASSRASSVPVAFDKPGTVTIDVANSVVPQLGSLAKRFLDGDTLGIADDLASRSIVAATAGVDPRPYLASLGALQRDDGGFALYRGARESDPFASGYALEALASARGHGFAIDESARARAHTYELRVLADPSRYTWCKAELCRAQMAFSALWALAADGERRGDDLDRIVAQQSRFDLPAQLRLARYLLAQPGWSAQGNAIAEHLLQAAHASGRYFTANVAEPWGWRDDAVAAQAETLELLLARHAPIDQLDAAARSLLAQQCRCGWPTIDSTAAAMTALDAYARTQPPQAMSVTVRDGAQTLGTLSLSGKPESKTLSFESARVHGSSIELVPSAGTLHYIVVYTYAVPADSPGALADFRVTRAVREPGAEAALATMDLAAMGANVELDSGRVFDVGIRIVVDHPVARVAIEDPLPAGFEAVDTTFATASQSDVAQTDNWEIGAREIYRDRVTAFAPSLGPGIYEMHYLVRSVTPGTYRWPGARVYLTDAPEQFGRSAAAILDLR